MSITVAIVEDEERLCLGMQAILNGSRGFICHQTYSSAEKAVRGLTKQPVDVVLMDISLKGKDGLWCIAELMRCQYPGQILVLSVLDDDDIIFKALQEGASGYLLKDSPPIEVLNSIQELHQGGSPMTASIARRVVQHFRALKSSASNHDLDVSLLSKREKELLDHIMRGYKYAEIACNMSISLNTVKGHARHIYDKLRVASRSELMARANSNGPLKS